MLVLLHGTSGACRSVQEAGSYPLGAAEIYSSGSSATPTHQLVPALVFFTGTGWRKENIVDAVKTAAEILGQCGIEIPSARLHLLDAPDKFKYYYVPISRELARIAPFPKPTVYFVKETLQAVGYDAEAIGKSNSGTRPELRDTIWIAFGARDLGFSLAHELAHVLMDSGEHIDEPDNLMNKESSPHSRKLSAGQCQRMRARGSENGLLRPVAR